MWRDRGDAVLVLSREKECANGLLQAYDIPYTSISRIGRNKLGLAAEMIWRDWRMWRAARGFKPDVLVGIMGVTIAQVGKLIRKPAIVFYDTEHAAITNRVIYPLAHSVCTPTCYQRTVNGNHVTYPGYHELAYLHPDRFSPDPAVLELVGVNPDDDYFIVRLVSWQASHDVGETGLPFLFVRQLVKRLEKAGPVLISSEVALPPDLEKYRFTLPPEQMHSVMAHATLMVGESATMASESAVLGVPALFISDTGRGYTDEEENAYGLVFNFTTSQTEPAMQKIEELLAMPNLKEEFRHRRARLLEDKIDTTVWLVDYADLVAGEDA